MLALDPGKLRYNLNEKIKGHYTSDLSDCEPTLDDPKRKRMRARLSTLDDGKKKMQLLRVSIRKRTYCMYKTLIE